MCRPAVRFGSLRIWNMLRYCDLMFRFTIHGHAICIFCVDITALTLELSPPAAGSVHVYSQVFSCFMYSDLAIARATMSGSATFPTVRLFQPQSILDCFFRSMIVLLYFPACPYVPCHRIGAGLSSLCDRRSAQEGTCLLTVDHHFINSPSLFRFKVATRLLGCLV
jgi:hypothetical protein